MRVIGNSGRRLVRRTVQLFAGLILYGASMALMIESGLGLTSWDVFHQGVAQVTGLSFGLVVILAGIPILLLWIPLRQRLGFGTVANVIVVGFAADGALAVLPAGHGLPMRITLLIAGIGLNGLATGMYIGARFGPGPRDGLMTGIVHRFPRLPLRVVRTGIELTVLGAGYLLGGTAGIGTIVYAVAIGPLVQLFLPMFTVRETAPPGVGMSPPVAAPAPAPALVRAPEPAPAPDPFSIPDPASRSVPGSVPVSTPLSVPDPGPHSVAVSTPRSVPDPGPHSVPVSTPLSVPDPGPHSVAVSTPLCIPPDNSCSAV